MKTRWRRVPEKTEHYVYERYDKATQSWTPLGGVALSRDAQTWRATYYPGAPKDFTEKWRAQAWILGIAAARSVKAEDAAQRENEGAEWSDPEPVLDRYKSSSREDPWRSHQAICDRPWER